MNYKNLYYINPHIYDHCIIMPYNQSNLTHHQKREEKKCSILIKVHNQIALLTSTKLRGSIYIYIYNILIICISYIHLHKPNFIPLSISVLYIHITKALLYLKLCIQRILIHIYFGYIYIIFHLPSSLPSPYNKL